MLCVGQGVGLDRFGSSTWVLDVFFDVCCSVVYECIGCKKKKQVSV